MMQFAVAAPMLAALAHAARLAPLRLLAAQGPSGRPAGVMAGQATTLNALHASLLRRLQAVTNLPFATLGRMAAKRRLDERGDAVRA